MLLPDRLFGGFVSSLSTALSTHAASAPEYSSPLEWTFDAQTHPYTDAHTLQNTFIWTPPGIKGNIGDVSKSEKTGHTMHVCLMQK